MTNLGLLTNRSRIRLLLLLVPTLAACADHSEDPAVTVWRDSAGIIIAESDPALAPACTVAAEPRTVIGSVSGEPMQELYRVFGARRLSTGEIAVANQGSQQVRVYGPEGQFVRAFGREGDGPGEFRDMFGLWALAGDSLWVGDYRPWRYQVYTADGQWVRTVQPEPAWPNPPSEWGLLSGGRPVLGEQERPVADRTFPQTMLRVILYDGRGVALDTLGPYPYGRWGRLRDDRRAIILFPLFESTTELAAAGRIVAIGHGAEPSVELFEVPESGAATGSEAIAEPARIIRWKTADRTVTSEDIQAERARLRERYAASSPMAREMARDLVSDERPVADRFPAFASLTLGTDGSLWVNEYPRPREPEIRRRLVFDADGRLRCRIVTPADVEIHEMGADYLLGKHRDEMDVERVVLYDYTTE